MKWKTEKRIVRQAGYRARMEDNLPLSANPYSIDSGRGYQWTKGWNEAEDEIRAAAEQEESFS